MLELTIEELAEIVEFLRREKHRLEFEIPTCLIYRLRRKLRTALFSLESTLTQSEIVIQLRFDVIDKSTVECKQMNLRIKL